VEDEAAYIKLPTNGREFWTVDGSEHVVEMYLKRNVAGQDHHLWSAHPQGESVECRACTCGAVQGGTQKQWQ
jgi:hypothetical protein